MEDEVSESLQKRERKPVHQHRAQPSIHTRTVPRTLAPTHLRILARWSGLSLTSPYHLLFISWPPLHKVPDIILLLTSFLASGDLANAVMRYLSYSSLFQAFYLGVYKMIGRKSSVFRKTWKWILSFFKIYEHKRGAVSWPLWACWLHPSKGMLVEASIRSLFCRWRNIFYFSAPTLCSTIFQTSYICEFILAAFCLLLSPTFLSDEMRMTMRKEFGSSWNMVPNK